jgi:DHA2 family methylenomycin A resistance protein-like MFS transporter
VTATLSTAPDTTRRAGTIAVLAVCLGFFLVMLDTTIVTVALPRIAADLGGGTSTLQWVVDSYTVVFAALVLTGGALADRLGARRVSVYGMLLFGVGSVGCAAATAGWMLAVARGVQGAGAAVLLPASLALIRSTFVDPRRQARVIGIWGGLGGVAAAAGPLLGALLVTAVGWPALFLLHVPFVGLAVVLVLRGLAETPVRRGTRIDVAGPVCSFAALLLLVSGLIELGHVGAAAVPLVTAGAVLLGVFAFVERRAAEPMLAADLLRHRGLRATVLTGFMLNFGFYGQFFLVTMYLQQQRHASVLFAGVALAVQAAGAIIVQAPAASSGTPCTRGPSRSV